MIAMSLSNPYDETRRDRGASAPVRPTPPHPRCHAMAHVLAMMGFGVGGAATVDNE